jgi:hypothetical protein
MRDEDDLSIRVPSDLLAAAAAVAAPPALLAAVWRSAESEPPDPIPGQIWRLLWDDLSALAVILEVGGDGLLVAPISIDPPVGDDRALVLDETVTVLGVAVAVWVGLARRIPTHVLDLYLDSLETEVKEALVRLRREVDGNMRLPAHTSLGQPVTSPFDAAADVEATLGDALDDLAAAAWVPNERAERRTLKEVLGPTFDLGALKSVLGVSLPAVWEIVRGRAPFTAAQARALARFAGVSEAEVLATVPPPPRELVREIDHPRWRPELHQLRRHRSLSDSAVRRDVAYGTLMMAARQTGVEAPSWRDRIRQYLAVGGS